MNLLRLGPTFTPRHPTVLQTVNFPRSTTYDLFNMLVDLGKHARLIVRILTCSVRSVAFAWLRRGSLDLNINVSA